MAQVFQLRRGTRAENDQFTGVEGEIVGVIDQTDTTVTTIRIHDDVLLGGHEVARADLLNTSDGTVTISEFATSLSQGGGPDTIIRYDSFGVAQFIDDFSGSQITSGTLNVSTLVGPPNFFLTFDGTGVVAGQLTIGTSDIVDESVGNVNFLDEAIDTPQIAINSIGTGDFGYLIVDTIKLADEAVGSSRIANSAVTTAKIADNTIDPVIHMPSQSITNAKFATAAVDNFRLADNTLRRDNVDANSAGNARGGRRIDDVDPDDAIGNDEDLYYQVQGPNSPTPPIPATPLLPILFTTPVVIASDQANVDLRAELIAVGWNGSDTVDTTFTVNASVTISSTDTANAGLTIQDIPAGSKLALNITATGQILGKGGEGGQGRDNGFGGNSSIFDGKDGGDAIRLINPNIQITLTNNGTIGGGGGGGGGGGASSYELTGVDTCTSGGGGGGGGAGIDPGAAGLKTNNVLSPDPQGAITDATDGALGSTLTGGAGGTNATGGSCGSFIDPLFTGSTNGGGVGGAGGDLGQPGGPGSPGLGSSGTGPGVSSGSGTVAGGNGGQAGISIFGISSFIVVTPGTIFGPQVS